MTDLSRSWWWLWLLVVDESVSEDSSSFDLSNFTSELCVLLLFECRIGFTRAWISGRSGDSSTYGMFSPRLSGFSVLLLSWVCLAGLDDGSCVTCVVGISSPSPNSNELRRDRILLSNTSVTVAESERAGKQAKNIKCVFVCENVIKMSIYKKSYMSLTFRRLFLLHVSTVWFIFGWTWNVVFR